AARGQRSSFRPVPVDPSSVAYMLYTSGSTGLPKGVQITHANVHAFFEAHDERVEYRAGDRCLSTGPFYFDVSVMDVLLPLHRGATVYFSPKVPIPSLLLRMIEMHEITHFYAVGTLLGLVTGDGSQLDEFNLSSLRILQTGAEICNVRVVNEWLKRYPNLAFLNSYGPTEVTVGCISYLKPYAGVLVGNDCPIGKPHRGTNVVLANATGEPIDRPNVVGELLISGPQVMHGYWQRPVENDRALVELDRTRYYRTGDLAYFDASFDYHFVGRCDSEIKLNGFRIHPNEVQRCLEQDERVVSALVGVVPTDSHTRELAVVLKLAGGCAMDTVYDIAESCRARLPAYMVPSRWGVVASIPRLASGKADRDTVFRDMVQAVARFHEQFFAGDVGQFLPLEHQ
ncbi:MAG TPA: AMP-binding protein, partial [Polyangiaceae bacterium]